MFSTDFRFCHTPQCGTCASTLCFWMIDHSSIKVPSLSAAAVVYQPKSGSSELLSFTPNRHQTCVLFQKDSLYTYIVPILSFPHRLRFGHQCPLPPTVPFASLFYSFETHFSRLFSERAECVSMPPPPPPYRLHQQHDTTTFTCACVLAYHTAL
ncbi:unnamed protein product [Calicophoron daubneyi]|uniref:Uncharacterized protein n=1 Tax=Calicophoron daubneyi TaxID=300641 RepID=A0AAV2SZK5_CALDB